MSMNGIIIIDYGSQYTSLIARRIREQGYGAEVISAPDRPTRIQAEGFILSGGPDSTAGNTDARPPAWISATGKPVLGICYGMQLLAVSAGGRALSGESRAFGKEQVCISEPDELLFAQLPRTLQVWMSHCDHIAELPACFEVIAQNTQGVIAGIKHRELPLWGLQFHPEVAQTTHGNRLLKNFCQRICKLDKNWQIKKQIPFLLEQIRTQVGDGKVLQAVSGGVDSTVAATLVTKALGNDRVHLVFIANGLLRRGEAQQVAETLRGMGLQNLSVLDCSTYFLEKLRGVTDPESKRKIIGSAFIHQFEKFSHGKNITHLGQGTLYSDVIESGGRDKTELIKSHHNVGGLPEKLGFTLVEPLRFLFKDEVRRLGQELQLPASILQRHPFPGPGLAIRIMGEVTAERLETLRQADAIYLSALQQHGLDKKIWQAFCVYLPVNSVGVMGDKRNTAATIVLRAVTSTDAMTAAVYEFPPAFLSTVADRIVSQVPGINRVTYDLTSKPPATIEWE